MLAAYDRDEVIDPWLEEIRDPVWHGTPAQKAEEAYAEMRGRPVDERWHGLDGGESIRDFTGRIHAGATEFLAEAGCRAHRSRAADLEHRRPGRAIALVAHAGTNSVTICHLLGLQPTPWEWERFVLGHTSVSRLEALPVATATRSASRSCPTSSICRATIAPADGGAAASATVGR